MNHRYSPAGGRVFPSW